VVLKNIPGRGTPLYRNAGFSFNTIEDSEEAFREELRSPQSSVHFIYTRFGNPTIIETEAQIAGIEGSRWALLTASGMAAIDTALSIFQRGRDTGTWLFFSEIYGGTSTYADTVLAKKRGIAIARFQPQTGKERFDLGKLAEALDTIKPGLLFFEPVTNPLLIVIDGKKVIEIAKKRGIPVIVDNTFATPLLWRPLEDGADIVIHSATKYLAGHGDITAGVVCGNDGVLRDGAFLYRKLVGNIVSPDDAYRLGNQLKTLPLRFSRQCEKALLLAKKLAKHRAVHGVRYPGLKHHPTHREAVNLFADKGSGALITFELNGGKRACDRFIKKVSGAVAYSPTLGDPETILIHVPTVFTQERFPFPGMLRLSVGFTDFEEVQRSIFTALDEL